MPQSSGWSPRPMLARSLMTFSTSGCSFRCSGIVVIRSARRFSSVTGTAVSAASVHLRFRNGIQSTANLFLKFDRTGSAVCLPASIAARYSLTFSSPNSAGTSFCAASFSAYTLRVPGCWLIFLYISGCVTAGVSCSLWPSLRKQMMSTTTSLLNSMRKSTASCMAYTTASGSSPFTCSTGASIILTTSVQYSVERASRGSEVVKPIWLLMTMCIVPPVP
ncbi:hypothetical protein D3C81_1104920 [compost metagenome]